MQAQTWKNEKWTKVEVFQWVDCYQNPPVQYFMELGGYNIIVTLNTPECQKNMPTRMFVLPNFYTEIA